MCLSSISKQIEKPSGLIECGWKAFNTNRFTSTLNFPHQEHNGSVHVEKDKWITANEVPIVYDGHGGTRHYQSGFHIYKNEREVKGVTVRRVYYRGVHTIGIQDNAAVVVARQMYVPSKEDDWPPKE